MSIRYKAQFHNAELGDYDVISADPSYLHEAIQLRVLHGSRVVGVWRDEGAGWVRI